MEGDGDDGSAYRLKKVVTNIRLRENVDPMGVILQGEIVASQYNAVHNDLT